MITFRVSRSEQDQKCYHLTLDVVQPADDPTVRGAGGKVTLEVQKDRFPFKPEVGDGFQFDFGEAFARERARLAREQAEAERKAAEQAAQDARDRAEMEKLAAVEAEKQAQAERLARLDAAKAELEEAEAAVDPKVRLKRAQAKVAAAEKAAKAGSDG